MSGNNRVIEFDQELVSETSYSSHNLGRMKNRMEYFPEKNYILWNFGEDAPDEDEVVIGVWVDDDNQLTDYDGVFSLPIEARKLLENCGIDCTYLDN